MHRRTDRGDSEPDQSRGVENRGRREGQRIKEQGQRTREEHKRREEGKKRNRGKQGEVKSRLRTAFSCFMGSFIFIN